MSDSGFLNFDHAKTSYCFIYYLVLRVPIGDFNEGVTNSFLNASFTYVYSRTHNTNINHMRDSKLQPLAL